MTRPQLLIRADASVEIGTGHVMRCLALAQAWQESGGDVAFACASLPPALIARFAAENVAVRMLDVLAGSVNDAQSAITFAREMRAETLVVDGYVFGAEYQRAIKDAGLRLLFIDDYGHADYYCADFVLNQNAYASSLSYSIAAGTMLLLGTPYALLRREFWEWGGIERMTPAVVRKVLVTLGGSDPDNVSLSVIDALQGLPFETTVIVGGSNPQLEIIRGAAEKAGIRIEVNVTDMSQWMAWADMAVTAAGSTCWEAALMGLPSLAIVIAPNQQQTGQWLEAQRLAVVLDKGVQPTKIRQAISDLAGDVTRRQLMSCVGQAISDGRGAKRVAELLQGRVRTGLRPVDMSDRGLVWLWANDSQTRANSFNKEPIPWETHCHWFDRQISAPDVRFWMLEHLAVPVGHIRYHASTGNRLATIGFTVGAQFRGKGYGTRLLRESAERACDELDVDALEGVAYADNIASVTAFHKAGFTLTEMRQIEDRKCAVFQWRCK